MSKKNQEINKTELHAIKLKKKKKLSHLCWVKNTGWLILNLRCQVILKSFGFIPEKFKVITGSTHLSVTNRTKEEYI